MPPTEQEIGCDDLRWSSTYKSLSFSISGSEGSRRPGLTFCPLCLPCFSPLSTGHEAPRSLPRLLINGPHPDHCVGSISTTGEKTAQNHPLISDFFLRLGVPEVPNHCAPSSPNPLPKPQPLKRQPYIGCDSACPLPPQAMPVTPGWTSDSVV